MSRFHFAMCAAVAYLFMAPALGLSQEKWPCVCVGETEADRRIEASLDVLVDADFKEAPLNEVVEFLGASSGIPIIIDNKSLKEAGIQADTPVTFAAKRIRLRAALTHILSELDLTWQVRDDVLKITTPEIAFQLRFVCMYNVSELANEEQRVESLTQAITELFPQGESNSPERLVRLGHVLIVAGNRDQQQQIAEFLFALNKAQQDNHSPKPAQP
jgi:type II secretory pathway component GspD/PulD (secretin)